MCSRGILPLLLWSLPAAGVAADAAPPAVATVPDYGFPRCYTSFPDYDAAFTGASCDERPLAGYKRFPYDGATAAECDALSAPPPLVALGPHWSPIGITVYEPPPDRENCRNCLPDDFDGALVVASHGSWNRCVEAHILNCHPRLVDDHLGRFCRTLFPHIKGFVFFSFVFAQIAVHWLQRQGIRFRPRSRQVEPLQRDGPAHAPATAAKRRHRHPDPTGGRADVSRRGRRAAFDRRQGRSRRADSAGGGTVPRPRRRSGRRGRRSRRTH